MSTKVRRWLEIYDGHFGCIAVSSVILIPTVWYIVVSPHLAIDRAGLEDFARLLLLVLGGPAIAILFYSALKYAKRRVEVILDSTVPIPLLVKCAQLPPLKINYFAAVHAAICAATGRLKVSRDAWKAASSDPAIRFLTHFDSFEEALSNRDFTQAEAELAEIFNPESMAVAVRIVYEFYCGHLKDVLLEESLKSLVFRMSPAHKLRSAVAMFLLKDYAESVRLFQSLAADRSSDPREKSACLRMMNLVVSAAATADEHWQRLHSKIFGELAPLYPLGIRPAGIVPRDMESAGSFNACGLVL